MPVIVSDANAYMHKSTDLDSNLEIVREIAKGVLINAL